jgi:hypothetical protein
MPPTAVLRNPRRRRSLGGANRIRPSAGTGFRGRRPPSRRSRDVRLFGARRHPRTAALPVEGHLPGFDGATGWLKSSPLTPAELRGRVVLVDFWPYTAASTGSARWPSCARGPRTTATSGSLSSASIRPSSRSSARSRTPARPQARASITSSSLSRPTDSRRKPTGRTCALPRPTSARRRGRTSTLPAVSHTTSLAATWRPSRCSSQLLLAAQTAFLAPYRAGVPV